MVNLEFTDELDDDEYPDEIQYADDWSDDDPAETVPCPSCHAEVYEDAPQCPECGHYISRDDRLRRGWWWTAILLLALVCFLVWTLLTVGP
jgi:uncharacterized paraquat-inducible protein A